MSRYPCDFTQEVDIDPQDILDYVIDNKEWFLNELGCIQKGDVTEILSKSNDWADAFIEKYNKVRIARDVSEKNRNNIEVQMYEDVVEIKRTIGQI